MGGDAAIPPIGGVWVAMSSLVKSVMVRNVDIIGVAMGAPVVFLSPEPEGAVVAVTHPPLWFESVLEATEGTEPVAMAG